MKRWKVSCELITAIFHRFYITISRRIRDLWIILILLVDWWFSPSYYLWRHTYHFPSHLNQHFTIIPDFPFRHDIYISSRLDNRHDNIIISSFMNFLHGCFVERQLFNSKVTFFLSYELLEVLHYSKKSLPYSKCISKFFNQ